MNAPETMHRTAARAVVARRPHRAETWPCNRDPRNAPPKNLRHSQTPFTRFEVFLEDSRSKDATYDLVAVIAIEKFVDETCLRKATSANIVGIAKHEASKGANQDIDDILFRGPWLDIVADDTSW